MTPASVEPNVVAAPVCLSVWAMACRFEVVLPSDGPGADGLGRASLVAAAEAAIEEIEQAHRRWNRYGADSLVSAINRAERDRSVRVDPETAAMLDLCGRVRGRSRGAFDEARGGVLDLGGVAKGWAIDLAIESLIDAGVADALVHGGTSSGRAIGHGPGGKAWMIRVPADPDHACADRLPADRGDAVEAGSERARPESSRSVTLDRGRPGPPSPGWSTVLAAEISDAAFAVSRMDAGGPGGRAKPGHIGSTGGMTNGSAVGSMVGPGNGSGSGSAGRPRAAAMVRCHATAGIGERPAGVCDAWATALVAGADLDAVPAGVDAWVIDGSDAGAAGWIRAAGSACSGSVT